MDPLYGVQGNLPKFPCKQYKGKHFLNFDNVPVKIHLNKLDFCNLLIKIFNLVPKFLMDFYRKIFTKWAPHSAVKGTLISFHAKIEGPSSKIDLVMTILMICLIFKIFQFLDFLTIVKRPAIFQISIFFENSNVQHLRFY